MSTSNQGRCRRCGAVIQGKRTDALCPACLMSGALRPIGQGEDTFADAPDSKQRSFDPIEFPCEFGDYRLLGFLGAGGMGTVYEAEQISTGRRVALKMLGHQLDSSEMRQRFLREGRLAAGVNHPNSLYIFGSEEIEGLPVITMEIASSGTLQDRLRKSGPFPVSEAVDATLDVIAGLESASAKGILHRDVKPSNCFVGPDGTVKVGDFGLSVSTLTKSDSLVTTLGRIMGTPAYASPEQLRGDNLDLRSDIYSVGATLFSLLTNRVPFEGENAVQVVANAVNKQAPPVSAFREDIPPRLDRIVARCLAKEPDERFESYAELRNSLLPFSSAEPEPASMKVRAQAGWLDYLTAFLVPYIILMLAVGNETFHFQLFMERTWYSARYYGIFLSLGILYFTIAEGIWGAGLGKRLKGLQVIRPNGRSPGILRALLRIVLPILTVEGIRIPVLLATISATSIDTLSVGDAVAYSAAAFLCPWIPVLLGMFARQKNGFATFWDRASGTRVIIRPEGTERAPIGPGTPEEVPSGEARYLGPYQLSNEIVPGSWIAGADPVLLRRVWLLRRESSRLPLTRRNIARPGRPRWLQSVERSGTIWDAFESIPGKAFSEIVQGGELVPWSTLRLWLHDLASELWAAAADRSLPLELSLDQVWITEDGRAVLLDRPWPRSETSAKRIAVTDTAGQQRFLSAVSAFVETTSLPLHARPVLRNLAAEKFDKLSFLTGILQGLLDKPAKVSAGIRAASIFMIPAYIWIMFFIGSYTGGRAQEWYPTLGWILMTPTLVVLLTAAVVQLMELPFRTTIGHTVFRLAVVDSKGERAGVFRLLVRWVIIWLPLLIPLSLVAAFVGIDQATLPLTASAVLILPWLGAAIAVIRQPNRGLQDWLSNTWVVRR
ncbi:MAG: protein kinase [Acidobacteriota bacterium]|nr:MAG: protein kinase [Acidobacteriota bacterium]